MLGILFLFFSHFDTSAEYRAYELTISDSITNQSRVVVTTLDHLQYPMYYTVHKDERTQITGTWMCKGRTDGFAPICMRSTPPVALTAPLKAPASTPVTPPAELPPTVKVAKP